MLRKFWKESLKVGFRKNLKIDNIQFGFMAGRTMRSMTDAFFYSLLAVEEYLPIAKKNDLSIALVDLKKGFYGVPQEGVWWALCTDVSFCGWMDSVSDESNEDPTMELREMGNEGWKSALFEENRVYDGEINVWTVECPWRTEGRVWICTVI